MQVYVCKWGAVQLTNIIMPQGGTTMFDDAANMTMQSRHSALYITYLSLSCICNRRTDPGSIHPPPGVAWLACKTHATLVGKHVISACVVT